MGTFFKAMLIALIYYTLIFVGIGCMFCLFTALFQAWDLWPKIFTTQTGRIVYFVLSIIVMLIALYMAIAYVQHETYKPKNDEKTD